MKYIPIHDNEYGERYRTWLAKTPEKIGNLQAYLEETNDLLIDLYYALIAAKARIKQLEADAEPPF